MNFQQIKQNYPALSKIIASSIGYPTPEKIKEVLKSYEKENHFLIGCFLSKKLIGVIGIECSFEKISIKHISVVKEFQSQGIGKKLIEYIIGRFASNYYSIIAETDKESVGFYKKAGFECSEINTAYLSRYCCQRNIKNQAVIQDEIDSKMITWAKEVLNIKDNQFFEPKIIIQTPWSGVIALHTTTEIFYLKYTPKLIGLEPQIIQLLHDKFEAPVPTVIAHNAELSCFLMKDAGVKLRTILQEKFDADLFCKAILQFTALQIKVENNIDDFIKLGVPDWRLKKLPDLYKEAILEKKLLISDGLLESDITELESLSPKIVDLCEQLSSYNIKDSIVQPDFNDNNTIVNTKTNAMTIIDLGEIAISHPFFSPINALHIVKKYHNLVEGDENYLKIKEACFKNYISLNSKQDILKAFKIAYVLWFVYGLLAYIRLMQACDPAQLSSFQKGKLSAMLKEFIVVCRAYKN